MLLTPHSNVQRKALAIKMRQNANHPMGIHLPHQRWKSKKETWRRWSHNISNAQKGADLNTLWADSMRLEKK
jgi:hypothetical protein